MYRPLFNKVLVEIDDKDAIWGKNTDGNMGGEVYREGKVLSAGSFIGTPDHHINAEGISHEIQELIGKQIMWHEGHEAGTVFEENNKKYALIYWFDIIGVNDDKQA